MSENDIGTKIRKIRELKGFSQEYMASRLNVSQRAYSKMERNESQLTWDKLTTIGEVLEVSPTDLISFDDSLVFHNSPQSGKMNTIHNYLSEELMDSLQSRIKHLEEEVVFLRSLVGKDKPAK